MQQTDASMSGGQTDFIYYYFNSKLGKQSLGWRGFLTKNIDFFAHASLNDSKN
ncbi:MAG: hypothetical protein ACKVOT_15995 [Polaromonas sp.]